jgi:hypothetical protein
MTIQQPQTPQQQGPTPVLQQQFGCGQSCLMVVLSFAVLIGGVFVKEAIFGPPHQAQLPPLPRSAPQPAGVTGVEMLAYLRATAPSAGGGVYTWTTDAVSDCAEGNDTHRALRTAAEGAACFAGKTATARTTLATLRALSVPPSLAAPHRELLAILEAEERTLSAVSASVTTLAPLVDRRRGRATWAAVWTGDGPDIPEIAAASRAADATMSSMEWIQRRAEWVHGMNRECDRVLRCVNREPAFGTGPVQIRCYWRSAVDALTGEERAYSVFADSESSLPACDGTRAPCHDPPRGFTR